MASLYDTDAESTLLAALIPCVQRRSVLSIGAVSATARELMSHGDVEEVCIGDGEEPEHVGILMVNAEPDTYSALASVPGVRADVVALECPQGSPDGHGVAAPVERILAELRPRGFEHFALVVQHGEFAALKWDDAQLEPGSTGKMFFLHRDTLAQMLPAVIACAGSLAQQSLRVGRAYMRAFGEREELVKKLRNAADERLALIGELERTCEERLALIGELERTCEQRLDVIHRLSQETQARPDEPSSADAHPEIQGSPA